MRSRGFTLSELMVGFLIGAIVILMIGAMGQIANSSYSQLHNRSGVYDDAQYAVDLITGSVRRAVSVGSMGNCLTVDDTDNSVDDPKNFYVYGGSLLYGTEACDSATNAPIITGVTGLTFSSNVSANLVHVNLSGTKSGASFDLSADAVRRNL